MNQSDDEKSNVSNFGHSGEIISLLLDCILGVPNRQTIGIDTQ